MGHFLAIISLICASVCSLNVAAADMPKLKWEVKQLVQIENDENVDNVLARAQELNNLNLLLSDTPGGINDLIKSTVQSLQVAVLGNIEPLEKSILRATSELSSLAQKLSKMFPNVTANINIVVAPTDGPTAPGSIIRDDYASYKQSVLNGMHAVQRQNYGLVNAKTPAFYFMGAALSIQLFKNGGDAYVQVLTGLNPQTFRQSPTDPIVEIPQASSPEEAVVMFVDVAQPLTSVLPRIGIRFGAIGAFEKKGNLVRFLMKPQAKAVGICSRKNSTPIIQFPVPVQYTNYSLPVYLPLYEIRLDLEARKVVGADARFGGIFGSWAVTCIPSSYIENQFKTEANYQFEQVRKTINRLFSTNPDDLSQFIKQQRRNDGIVDFKP
jgi:hypothetical protein